MPADITAVIMGVMAVDTIAVVMDGMMDGRWLRQSWVPLLF
jgi:hypothetical protein